MRNIEDEEKYTFVVKDDKNDKNWIISLKWLKQHLQYSLMNDYPNLFHMEFLILNLEKKVKFLRELNEPQIIEYFYFKIFQLVKDRSKKFHQSFIMSKIKHFGLFEERSKAWDKLIEDNIILDCKNSGWYQTAIFTSLKFSKLKVADHIKRMG